MGDGEGDGDCIGVCGKLSLTVGDGVTGTVAVGVGLGVAVTVGVGVGVTGREGLGQTLQPGHCEVVGHNKGVDFGQEKELAPEPELGAAIAALSKRNEPATNCRRKKIQFRLNLIILNSPNKCSA